MFKIVVLASGGGSNLQAVIDAMQDDLPICIELVITDRDCYALTRANNAGIKSYLVDRKLEKANLCNAIDKLIPVDCDLIVLAGFLSILSKDFTTKWAKKIINIHPSLLPRHGGAGMWGMHVHNAVIAAGDKISGCSVHYVSEEIDGGEVLKQMQVELLPTDSAEDVQKKVLELEHKILPAVIRELALFDIKKLAC